MVTEEQKRNIQNVGLDLTQEIGDEITSGYMHFEKINPIDEKDRKSKSINRFGNIETKFNKFGKKL